MKKILIPVLAAAFIAGCAPGVKTMKNQSFSAEKYKRIAVIDFEGNNQEAGSTLAEMFVPHLMEMGFDVVERANMNKLLKEQKAGLSGALDSASIHQIGKILGVDALVFGNFHYTKKEAKHTTILSKKRPLRFWQNRTTAFTTFTSEVVLDGITVRLVDIETGKVLISSNYPKEVNGEEVDACFEEITKSIKENLKAK